ncbi:permease prefix domain 1-containing protein [Alicyclobacillus shizuokensis]|uniref:permease prefix domain 1-containing protein n=1 Tax=Alicyclobacillus shizuokensis TaxID=392014 RepID=UPI0008369B22|nr:permease prefix domain 1-containing protein [Alicyclobacillus shizuokensis]
MNDLERYVNRLFAKYKHKKGVLELRDEVLANLQARIDDEMSEGASYQVAFDHAVKSLGNVELLIEGHGRVPLNPLKRELAQLAVLYTLIPWIITIPCWLFHSGVLANTALTLLLVIVGVVYITLLFSRASDETTRVINVERLRNIARVVWVLWGVYVVISECFALGAWFASNIWFNRAIHIDGPYMFADLAVSVLLPFVSVFIPLYFMRIHRLVQTRGVSE